MSLARLQFDGAEKVLLRAHTSYSLGKHTPAEMAVFAREQGLHVIAITDCATVDGIAEMIAAGEKLGIYVIPGIEIHSSAGIFWGYFIDHQDKHLLRFLENIKKSSGALYRRSCTQLSALYRKRPEYSSDLPSPQEVIRVLAKAGALPVMAGAQEEIGNEFRAEAGYWSIPVNKLNTVTNGDILRKIQQALPDNSLHKDYFARMYWRSANLSSDEFSDSLQPRIIRLRKIKFEHFLAVPFTAGFVLNSGRVVLNSVPFTADAPMDEEKIPGDFRGLPFILARGEALEKIEVIKSILERFDCSVISEATSDHYREIAWQIYNMGAGSKVQKTRNLLKFNLDDRLYSERAAHCRVLFFHNPKSAPLRNIKKALRQEIGRMQFYRIEYRGQIDTFFTSYVHLPDEDNIPHENWILYHLGMFVPLV